jgi:hypothetical protein
MARLSHVLKDLFGLEISEGALVNILSAGRKPFAAQTSLIKARLLAGTALASDETGMRVGNRFAGSRDILALFRGCSLFAYHAERDADALRLLTRCPLCSFESFRNLCGGLLASHTLEKADINFRPRSPDWRLLTPCNGFSHVRSCLVDLWYDRRYA